jgi:type IV pilus assembly protein PilC
MPVFSYVARDRNGQQHSNVIESATREAAAAALRRQGLLPVALTEIAKPGARRRFSLNPFAYRSLNSFDIEHEFHQIAVMLRSGVSLLEALELTAKHSRIGTYQVWERLAKRIQQGSSFTDALAEHKPFSEFTRQLIHVGEQSGYLHRVMDQAAEELKSSRKIKKQVLAALRYPAFTLLLAIGVVIFLLTKVIPEIKKLLKIMGKPMPPITQALIDTSDWVMAHGLFIGTVVALVGAAFTLLYNWPPSRWWLDKAALRVPVFGTVFRLSGTVLFTRALGLLLRSGVLIVDALETLEKLHVNKYLAGRAAFARRRVIQGSSLAEPLEAEDAYMPLMVRMVRIGEVSGTLDEILLEMTVYHDELLHQAIARLIGLVAPAMTIFVGGVIGFTYAAFLVAMFSAAGGKPS